MEVYLNKEILMKKIRKSFVAMACALGASAVLAGAGSVIASSGKDDVLATIGRQTLTTSDLDAQIKGMPPQLQMALLRNPSLKERLLERWVQMTLMSMEAQKEGMDKKPDVKKRIKEMTDAVLAQEYMTEKVKDKVSVTDAEMKKYYDEHKDEFKNPETVTARHILIRVQSGADKSAWDKALDKAKSIEKKLKKGADFAKLAKEFSDDPGSKQKGGDLGPFTKGRMVPEFEKAAFSLKKGEISAPVKTNFGYHIIQVTDKKAASQKTFEEAKAGLKRKLEKEKQQKFMEDLMARLKKQYKVKEYPEHLKSAMPKDAVHQGMHKK